MAELKTPENDKTVSKIEPEGKEAAKISTGPTPKGEKKVPLATK